MNRRSIVLRLSVGFALTTLILVGLGSAYLYSSLNRILLREGEDDLNRATASIIRRLEESHGTSAHLVEGIEMRIFDQSGRMILQSPGMPALPFLQNSEPGKAMPAEIQTESGVRFMVLGTDSLSGHVQVARDLSPEARRLSRFRRALLATLGLTTLAAAFVGLWISRRGLRPLRFLADQALNIHPEALATRLHLAESPAELSPLVDALNRSLSRLETAFSRLAALNADMAHELRTPVHALKIEAERLLSQTDLPLEVEEGLSGMMETLDHMGAMIGQMLFLARIEDPSAVLDRTRLCAKDLLRSTVEPFELLAEEAGVYFEVKAPPDLYITGDGILLRRALHNLIDNAIRHSPIGSMVSIQAWESPESAILCVGDHGKGIPEAHRQKLGQRFLRSDPSRSRDTGGTGLGLAIVHSIVHLHGGEFEIRSTPEEGTQAFLLLPRI